jgi:hypothetical protein
MFLYTTVRKEVNRLVYMSSRGRDFRLSILKQQEPTRQPLI